MPAKAQSKIAEGESVDFFPLTCYKAAVLSKAPLT